jgi:iron complex outermembrane receptor protein
MSKRAIMSILTSLFLTFGILFNANAQTVDKEAVDYSSNDTIPLQEAVISGTKTLTNRNQTPTTISVVSRPTLEASTETGILSILSEQIPGLYVTERGVTGYGISSGSAGTINIHGVGGGNKVLMLFDGKPMWAGIFGHHIPDVYVTSDAERVEVIRGPGSLLYGSNAMGGIINVITRKAERDGIHGTGRIMYGSYNTQKYMASAGYKNKKFNALLSLNRDQSDGHRDNSKFHINNGYLKLGYELTDNWNITGDAIIAGFKVNNPGRIDVPMIDNWAEALRSTYSFSVNNNYQKMSGSLQVFYNNGKHKINDGHTAGDPARTAFFKSDDFNMGISLFESFRLFDGNLFTLGFDAKQWGGKAWNEDMTTGAETGTLMDNKVNEFAGYAVAQQNLFDRLTLNAGIRLEHNETYGNEWIPQVGAAYRLTKSASLKASASKGFRSPNVNDLFSPWGANPDLKPEKMNNYDISYLQSLCDNKLHLEFTAYFAQGKNMIMTVNRKKENTGEFINKGVDFAFNYHVLSQLNISGNYSYLFSDTQITAAPKHKAFLNVNWTVGRFNISPNLQYVDGLYLETANNKDVFENYTLFNCKVAYKAAKWISLFLNGENLFDTSYQTYAGYPMPGIVVLAGMNFSF